MAKRKYPTKEELVDIPEVDFTKAKKVRRGPSKSSQNTVEGSTIVLKPGDCALYFSKSGQVRILVPPDSDEVPVSKGYAGAMVCMAVVQDEKLSALGLKIVLEAIQKAGYDPESFPKPRTKLRQRKIKKA